MDDKTFDKIVKNFYNEIVNNMENIIIESNHRFGLEEFIKEKNKKSFKNSFENIFNMGVFLSITKYGEVRYPITGFFTCWNCGKHIKVLFDGNKIFDEKVEECFNKSIYSFKIAIPSGKLLLNDWVAYGNDIFGEQNENVNYLIGKYKQSENYARFNCLHMFVGNSSPRVMQKENTILIENPGYIERDDGDIEIFTDETFEEKGYICTDLWWTTAIDLEYYKMLLHFNFGKNMEEDENVKETLNNSVIVYVEPGTYKCTSYYDSIDFDNYEKPQLFIKMEKI